MIEIQTKKHPVKISVIIPVYNTERYLRRCLASVLENSYKNLEVICVNDGSTDNSLQILYSIAASDSRLRIIDKSNEGVSIARNVSLEAATGDFIAFIDSDDWIHPQYFEILLDVQKRVSADIVVCDYLMTSDVTAYNKSTQTDYTVYTSPYEAARISSVIRPVWGRIYSKACVQSAFFRRELAYGEDADFNHQVFFSSHDIKIAHVREKLYMYYQRESSLSHAPSSSDRAGLSKVYLSYAEDEKLPKQLIELYLTKAYKEALSYRYSKTSSSSYKEDKIACRQLISKCRIIQEKRKYVSQKQWLVLELMFNFPILYRLFRLINDPTLIRWEKEQRRKKDENDVVKQ